MPRHSPNRIIVGDSVAIILCRTSRGRVFSALIDKSDVAKASSRRWRAVEDTRTVYIVSGGRYDTLHKFLTGFDYVDHANGRGTDNRRTNLRRSDDSLNQANRRTAMRWGFRGVTRLPNGKFQASIKCKGRNYYLGMFAEAADAGRAYDAKASELFGEFARLNFPTEAA